MASGATKKFPAAAVAVARSLTTTVSTPPPLSLAAAGTVSPTLFSEQRTKVLNLCNTERLFASVPTAALVRSLAMLCVMAVEPAVDLGMALMKSRTVMESRLGRAAVMAGVRATVYRQFCAGEGAEEAGRTLTRLWEAGLRGILDYGLEDAEDNDACDRNLQGFLNAVGTTESLPPSSVSFACAKITAICPISLLERVSDLLRWEQRDPSFHLPWKTKTLPVLSESSPPYHTPFPPHPLTDTEERDLTLAQQRLSVLCNRCAQADLPLLVDAEYTSVQPAIDYLTFSAALQFNHADRPMPIVYGTVQAYLKDSKDRIIKAVEAAEKEGIPIGFKLVRGAYLTRENALASSLGAPSPIHNTIQETHQCYNDCASYMLECAAKGGSTSVVLATHNHESGRVASAKALELGIGKRDMKLHFAQLMGMADGLSLALKNAGFQVSKYLPYGPVEQVMPYLLRRAEENRGLLSASAVDRELIRKELAKRLVAALLGGQEKWFMLHHPYVLHTDSEARYIYHRRRKRCNSSYRLQS